MAIIIGGAKSIVPTHSLRMPRPTQPGIDDSRHSPRGLLFSRIGQKPTGHLDHFLFAELLPVSGIPSCYQIVRGDPRHATLAGENYHKKPVSDFAGTGGALGAGSSPTKRCVDSSLT